MSRIPIAVLVVLLGGVVAQALLIDASRLTNQKERTARLLEEIKGTPDICGDGTISQIEGVVAAGPVVSGTAQETVTDTTHEGSSYEASVVGSSQTTTEASIQTAPCVEVGRFAVAAPLSSIVAETEATSSASTNQLATESHQTETAPELARGSNECQEQSYTTVTSPSTLPLAPHLNSPDSVGCSSLPIYSSYIAEATLQPSDISTPQQEYGKSSMEPASSTGNSNQCSQEQHSQGKITDEENEQEWRCMVFDGADCQQCFPQYVLVMGMCVQIPKGCITFNVKRNRCLACDNGLTLTEEGRCY